MAQTKQPFLSFIILDLFLAYDTINHWQPPLPSGKAWSWTFLLRGPTFHWHSWGARFWWSHEGEDSERKRAGRFDVGRSSSRDDLESSGWKWRELDWVPLFLSKVRVKPRWKCQYWRKWINFRNTVKNKLTNPKEMNTMVINQHRWSR